MGNFPILSQFPDFHQFAIFLQNDVIMQQQFQLHATSSSMPCHAMSSYLPYHHPCHVITTLVFHWVCPVIISTGYSFVIREHLWYQWQLYTQQSPPLALMATSKHSPPLTTMTKDNLLCQCCTYFDIGFPIFLLSNNSPCHHISPLLTETGI